ncbi:thiamine phosphate synthase [Nautilia lithotrophica]
MRNFIKYMITDPSYSLNDIKNSIIKHKPDFICYRNKKYFNKREIIDFADFAKNHSKIFINYDTLKNDFTLLSFFDGIHLPSSQIKKINDFKNKIIIVSTHTAQEAKEAVNADFITFSPIYESKNRPGLGIETLNKICNIHPNVIALGGIVSEKEVKEIKRSKAVGFASIRYFFT